MPKNEYLGKTRKEYYKDYISQDEHKARQKKYKETYDLRLKTYIAEQLGSSCCKCGSKDRLELDHINPKLYHDKKRRGFNTSMKVFEQTKDNLQILCYDCHKKRSRAQQKAAWELFINLPLDEQERLMLQYE